MSRHLEKASGAVCSSGDVGSECTELSDLAWSLSIAVDLLGLPQPPQLSSLGHDTGM